MSTTILEDIKYFKSLLESVSSESSVGMNPTSAVNSSELNRFQQMPADKQKIASPAQQDSLDNEATSRQMDEETQIAECKISGRTVNVNSIEIEGADRSNEQSDAYASYAEFDDGTPLSNNELDQLTTEYAEEIQDIARKSMYEGQTVTDEGNEFSGARKAAIAAGKDHFTVDGKTYQVTGTEELSEGPTDNFTIKDLKKLEQLPTLEDMKAFAKELIATPSRRPMQPQKVRWFLQAIDSKTSPNAIIKLMYDLLLGGEGHKVIGSKHSTDANSYRSTFREDGSMPVSPAGEQGPNAPNPFRDYKRNDVHDQHNCDQWDHPDGSYIQVNHGQDFHAVHQDPSGNRTTCKDMPELTAHLAGMHPSTDESTTANQFEDPTSADHTAKADWNKAGTTDQSYSKASQNKWDGYMNNESTEWSDLTLETTAHLSEKWNKDTAPNPKKKGMFAGKTKADLKKEYASLKASGPHKKDSADNIKMKELAFAIRAKGDWGKIDESITNAATSDDSAEAVMLARMRQLSGLK